MSRRRFIYYWALHGLIAFVAVMVQAGVFSRVTLWGLHPTAVLFVPAIVATYNPLRQSLVFAALLGIACDLLDVAPLSVFYLLTFLLITVAAFAVSRRLQPTLLCSLVVCFAAGVITGMVRLFLLSMGKHFAFAVAASLLGRELLISLLPAAALHGLFSLLRKRNPPPLT